jgi:hypothetical protein
MKLIRTIKIFISLTFITFLLNSCKSSKIIIPELNVSIENGLNGILPGATNESVIKLLGTPDEIDKYSHLYYLQHGIEFNTDGKKVGAIFYYFRSVKLKSFQGKLFNGINALTTIEELKVKLGEPERISTSVVSRYGEFPGETEIFVSYPKNGVSFSFYNNRLANIRQYARK